MVNVKGPRPEGTDGSDNSYRMIIEDRYKRMALLRKLTGWLMMVNVVLMLLITAWNAVPMLEGRPFPMMPMVLLAVEVICVLAYFQAAPGTGRESLKFIKAYGFLTFLIASEHILTRFWYHVHLPKEVLYPKVLVAYFDSKYQYKDQGTLLVALQSWEATLDGSLAVSLLAAAWICNSYIIEKRAPVGVSAVPDNRAAADKKRD